MRTPPPAAVIVSEASQIGEARRAAVGVADAVGLSETKRGEVAIVATELATNLARYARGGRVFLQAVVTRGRIGVEVLAVDSGPGIADVRRSLEDGYSSGGTAGQGLGAVRRLSDEFDIYSTVDAGTVVLSRVCSPREDEPSAFHWAALSTPAPHEVVCGDAWSVVEGENGVAVMVADGLGHGPQAADAARRAAEVFEANGFDAPGAFCERAHRALSGSRGAALAVASVSADGGLRYAGLGNISGTMVSPGQSKGMFSQNGTAGVQFRRAQELTYEWPERGVLVMHSDGLTNRWSLEDYRGLIVRHPAIVAAVLHRDFGRGRDDATVVVVRRAAKDALHG